VRAAAVPDYATGVCPRNPVIARARVTDGRTDVLPLINFTLTNDVRVSTVDFG
jgi:hypothetical protein